MNTPQEFAELLTGLRRLEATGFTGGAALATLTRTRGPTFRRPGARMLVCGDGTIVRGLSGGCPEADVITRAREVIAEGQSRIVRYNREQGLDALIEMGCEGELEVLIEPLSCAEDLRFVTAVEHCLNTRTAGFLATAFARDGQCLTPRPRRLVWADKMASDDFGDSVLSNAVIAHGSAANGDVRPAIERFETGTGAMEVLIERLLPPHALVLMGVNAGSLALARLAVQLGWMTTLVDHRGDSPEPADLPAGVRLIRTPPESLRRRIAFDSRSSAVAMTFNLERDIAYLAALRDSPLAYLGAIGSRARTAKLREATGLASPPLRAPAGLDLGSETPEEIALAIAAEILAAITGHSGGVLSAASSPIH
jgi:xanthine/CO dehydrogenase XdhC/CoxF family maturation factor